MRYSYLAAMITPRWIPYFTLYRWARRTDSLCRQFWDHERSDARSNFKVVNWYLNRYITILLILYNLAAKVLSFGCLLSHQNGTNLALSSALQFYFDNVCKACFIALVSLIFSFNLHINVVRPSCLTSRGLARLDFAISPLVELCLVFKENAHFLACA